ncbi:MAG TPA: MerR family transcriptional regulator, partial [Bacteroidales bacterium]|nr:MerR family transcriptional regulator [Bacteroidales bacterium]
EINLLKPTGVSEAGYRLYDDKALEKLQQILFFKEFELPLKKIKAIMNNPYFDRNQTLLDQKELLVLKRDRLNGLIVLIDEIMKGEKNVSFEAFSNTELEEMFEHLLTNADTGLLEKMTREHGSVEGWKKHFVEAAGSEKSRENMGKLIQWYGSKEKAMEASKKPARRGNYKRMSG